MSESLKPNYSLLAIGDNVNLNSGIHALGNIALWIGIGFWVGWQLNRLLSKGRRQTLFMHVGSGMLGSCLGTIFWHNAHLADNWNLFLRLLMPGLLGNFLVLPGNLLRLTQWLLLGGVAFLGALVMVVLLHYTRSRVPLDG